MIRFANGMTVDLSVSWIRHQATADERNVELFGTEAGGSVFPLNLYRFGKKSGEYEIVEPQNVRLDRPRVDRHADWIDGILKRRKPICTLPQALSVQKILDAVYASSRTGREVRLD